MRMFVVGVAVVVGVVVTPSVSFGARNTKPAEIVVVGSKVEKKGAGKVTPGDTLINRWQRSGRSGKKLQSK
jgi:hypothetical protein